MNPDPTITASLDYLVELSDDGEQTDQQEPEVINLPPAPYAADAAPALEQGPQS